MTTLRDVARTLEGRDAPGWALRDVTINGRKIQMAAQIEETTDRKIVENPTVRAHRDPETVFGEVVALYHQASRGGLSWNGDTARVVLGTLLDVLHLHDSSLNAETYVAPAPVVPGASFQPYAPGQNPADFARALVQEMTNAGWTPPAIPAESQAAAESYRDSRSSVLAQPEDFRPVTVDPVPLVEDGSGVRHDPPTTGTP